MHPTLPINDDKRFKKLAAVMLSFLFVVRLISMWLIPLNDSTEARYGEIARKMLETGNWITPLHDYGVPFWAKPPLSMWFSALSMQCFGINEFAARLPSLLLSLGVLGLVYSLAKRQRGFEFGLSSLLFLSGSLVFYLDAGAVMTDPAFLFSVTLTLIAFWRAMQLQERDWSYLFFVGLSLGLMAKGPLILVLTGLPIFFWALFLNQWSHLWTRFPWVKGVLLILFMVVPWYWLAEHRTPGFINYFLIGEHYSRFMEPGWTGDKYGFAHHEPLGMIWVYLLVGILPWVVPLCYTYRSKKRYQAQLPNRDNHWLLFLILWLLSPLIFFSFASNVIYPYVLPCMPAIALLLAELLVGRYLEKKWIIRLTMVSGLVLLIGTGLFLYKPSLIEKSQKKMIVEWLETKPETQEKLFIWGEKLEASAQFYANGRAHIVHNKKVLEHLLMDTSKKNTLIIPKNLAHEIPEQAFVQMKWIKNIVVGDNSFYMYVF